MATATSERTAEKAATHGEWLAARKQLLTKEKEFTRSRDELSRMRRELPREKVDKKYVFESARGKETLADLFDGRSQLIIYHFMFGPGWKEGCPSCSFLADTFDGAIPHLAQRDVTFVAVSRATVPEIEAFEKRMGWKFKWVSSNNSDFNFDYHVSFTKEEMAKGKVSYNYGMTEFPSEEAPGASVFYRDASGEIFHTYSAYARGLDILLTAYNYIDMTPKGRAEEGLSHPMAWVRHHDRYGNTEEAACCGGKEAATKANPLLNEFREEVETTRRILARVPADKLSWRPHPRSMTLGQLAIHIASVPGSLARITQGDEFDVTQGSFNPVQPKGLGDIQEAFEQSVRDADAYLKDLTDQKAQGNWRLMSKERQIFARPRIEVLRSIMLNHWYHHRGQLSVYLRMLEVPVPVIYGPSADENPFM